MLFKLPFNVHWDIILFTGAICALLLHQSIFPTCTCRCSCRWIFVYVRARVSCTHVMCVSNEKGAIETRIKRIETFIIYALFSVVAILFPFLLTCGTFNSHVSIYTISINVTKCTRLYSRALIFTGSHTWAQALKFS